MVLRYKSVNFLKEKIAALVSAGDLNRSLRLIHDFVEHIITEPLCTSQVFGSKDLDDLCQLIGKANLSDIKKKHVFTKKNNQTPHAVTYIVTKLQRSGGHSQVIKDFIKAQPEVQHIILSTELAGQSDADYFLDEMVTQTSVSFEVSGKGDYQQHLTWLQKRLIEIQPEKTYLFNHHQDSVAVAAIQPEMGLAAYFYHHGDHHLCLGVHLEHLKHIDPHPMGYRNCRNVLGIENSYIPLTLDDKGDRPADIPFFNNGVLTTCTAARSNKIEIPYFVSYLDLVPKLLKATRGRHIHIGRLTPWALSKIRRGLKRYGIPHDQFTYTPWVPSVWKSLHDYRVDLYIASFPYGGGLTLIETMGAGIPVALHKHLYSRILSCIDLAYPRAFNWRSPDELLDFCQTLTPDFLETQSRAARLQYLKFHRREVLEDILCDRGQAELADSDLKDTYSIESDEWAYWMERQVSFERVIRRGVYRIFRAIRARFF